MGNGIIITLMVHGDKTEYENIATQTKGEK